jgi:hypothetical protein
MRAAAAPAMRPRTRDAMGTDAERSTPLGCSPCRFLRRAQPRGPPSIWSDALIQYSLSTGWLVSEIVLVFFIIITLV